MSKKLFEVVLLVFWVRECFSLCEMGQEQCKCFGSVIKCLETKNEAIVLDFNELKYDFQQFYATLNISNKQLTRIISVKKSNQTFTFQTLVLSNNKINTLKANSFEGGLFSQLMNLNMNENFITNIETNAFVGVPVSLKSLELKSNKIKEIKIGAFNFLDNLSEINFDSNEIEQIEIGAFRSFLNIRSIILNSNRLKSIKRGVFDNLSNIQHLEFVSNQIESIEADSFSGSIKLTVLILSSNNLKTIKYGIFKNLFNLAVLSLRSNQIELIESNSFEGLKSVFHMDFYLNKIKCLQRDTFKRLPQLNHFDIDQNEINSMEKFSFVNLNSLEKLSLVSQKIKFIQNETFVNLTSLTHLELFENEIEFIEENSFSCIPNLKILWLYSNKIQSIKSDFFKGLLPLKELRLDKNGLRSIEVNSFRDLKNLISLDLHSNQLNSILNGVFYGLTSLRDLNLNQNNVMHIEPFAFIGLSALETLKLESHRLKSVSGIRFNSNLTELFLKFNQITKINLNSDGLEMLDISNNLIQIIEKDSFQNLISLKNLSLSKNRIIGMENGSFGRLKKLLSLDLSFNYLDSLSGSKFLGLDNIDTLDLSFNQIQFIENNTWIYVRTLKNLYLHNNKFKIIEKFYFGSIKNVENLNIESNYIHTIKSESFKSLASLKEFSLSSNRIKSIGSIKENLKKLSLLESINLSNNLIEDVLENDFEFNTNLKSINLNSNRIRFFHQSALEKLKFLQTFKISQNNLDFFNLSIFNLKNITELDLSFNKISVDASEKNFEHLLRIKGEKVQFLNSNKSLKLFLSNSNLAFIDLSNNDLTKFFKSFDKLNKVETLILKSVKLQSIEQLDLRNNSNLKYLDLSFNNLTELNAQSFGSLFNLMHLDLSHNRIDFVDDDIFSKSALSKYLIYLNLQNNRIVHLNQDIKGLNNIRVLNLANNQLETFSNLHFQSDMIIEFLYNFREYYLSNNNISSVKYFSYFLGELLILNFDTNQIAQIEYDAFLNLRSLESLSISNNLLTEIKANNFQYLFSLKYLNLSQNQIELIEENSFQNLNKLETLDLSFNNLKSIQSNLFLGLENLKDLYLYLLWSNGGQHLSLGNESFSHLVNIGNIHMNYSTIIEYKCIFMHSIERKIQRKVSDKYLFYKSINLLTFAGDQVRIDNNESECQLRFRFLQFKIHFNLKSDYENEIFYEKCQNALIKKENKFYNSKNICLKTSNSISYEIETQSDKETSKIFLVLSNGVYLLTMIALLIYLGLVYLLLVMHLFGTENHGANYNMNGHLNIYFRNQMF
jgi:Leucine-rich repeat (LRR) protein